jgi:hypothetical protein
VTEKDTSPDCTPHNNPEPAGTTSCSELSGCSSLERIIDITGEMAHLNDLVLLHLEKCGGYTTPEAYFKIVQPLLDLLEVEIGVRYRSGMTTKEIKLIVQDWIDCEIAVLRKSR